MSLYCAASEVMPTVMVVINKIMHGAVLSKDIICLQNGVC